MRIFIPTCGRANRQITWGNLPPSIQQKTRLVVRWNDEETYPKDSSLYLLPPTIPTNIGSVRQYLLETFPTEKICMLDDDLQFAVRREDDPTKFRAPGILDIMQMFEKLERSLDEMNFLVGVSAREGANYDTGEYKVATRQMRVHAIDAKVYHQLGIRYDRMELMEDFDVILQYLEKGYANLVLNRWVTNQGGSNTSGGCSTYRTLERQAAAAEQLAKFHPDFVKVVTKQTKTSWGGQERKDVRVQWQKAYAAGRARLLDQGKRIGSH